MTAGGKLFLLGVAVSIAGAARLAVSGALRAGPAALERNPQAGILAAGMGLAFVGCLVYVVQPVLDRRVAARTPFATVRTCLAMLILAIVVANLISLPVVVRGGRGVAAGGPGEPALGPLGLVYLIAASELPILGVVWLRLVASGAMSWQGLGLRAKAVWEHISGGLAGGLALFLAAGIVGGVLTRFGVKQNQVERFSGIQGAPLGLFVLAVLAGCVLAPFVEEIFFRGYIFQTFSQRYSRWWGYLFSAGLFTIVHANIAAAAPIFVLGLMLAFIFQRTGSLLPGMIAHGVNNAISFALLYWGATG